MAPLSPTEIAFEQSHISEAVGPRTIGVSCMFVVLCSAVLGGRFYARRLRKAGLESDDYLAVAAHVRCNHSIPEKPPDRAITRFSFLELQFNVSVVKMLL